MKTNLKQNEKILLSIRQHWFVLIVPVFFTFVFLLFSIVGIQSEFSGFFFIAGLASILYLLYKVIDRKTNIWVVTNLRVIDEYGVFSVNSKESPLDKINNVSYRKPLLGRIFNYGNVHIQTAAEMGSTIHKMLEKPKLLKDKITEQQEIFRQEQIKEHAQKLANAVGVNQSNTKTNLSEELLRLHELKTKGILTEEEFNGLKFKLLNG
jgi:uncharacterized membrane protein YdbT with pleckstrin-like domain